MSAAAAPRVPAHVRPYVEVLGQEMAIALLLAFGGTSVYLGEASTGRGQVAAVIGAEGLRALAARMSAGKVDLPLAKPWIAAVRRAEGRTVQAIAREMHATEATVRRWLRAAEEGEGPARPTGQLTLL